MLHTSSAQETPCEYQAEVSLTLDEFNAIKAAMPAVSDTSVSVKIHFTFADECSAIKFLDGYEIKKVDLLKEKFFDTTDFQNIKGGKWIQQIERPGQNPEFITMKLLNRIQRESSHSSSHLVFTRENTPDISEELKEFTSFNVSRVLLEPKETTNKNIKETLTLELASFSTGDYHHVFCLTFVTSLEALQEGLKELREIRPNQTNAHLSRSKIMENIFRLGKLKPDSFGELYAALQGSGQVLANSMYRSLGWTTLSSVEHLLDEEPLPFDPDFNKQVAQLSEDQEQPEFNCHGLEALKFQDQIKSVYYKQYPKPAVEVDDDNEEHQGSLACSTTAIVYSQSAGSHWSSQEVEQSSFAPLILLKIPATQRIAVILDHSLLSEEQMTTTLFNIINVHYDYFSHDRR